MVRGVCVGVVGGPGNVEDKINVCFKSGILHGMPVRNHLEIECELRGEVNRTANSMPELHVGACFFFTVVKFI